MTAQSPVATVAVVIVNWNRRDDTLRCLRSLEEVEAPTLATYLVDNASGDDSVAAVRAAFPAVTIIETGRNAGFAEGNNVALRLIGALGHPYVLLLNCDAFVAPDTIARLLDALRADPRIGICGPAICYAALPEQVWSAGGAIDWRRGIVANHHTDRPLGSLPTAPYAVDHVSGCCMLVRASAIAAAGLLDARFFMYFEESEWCVRIARHGFGCVVVPGARAWHDISPRRYTGSPFVAYYMTRNQLLFLRATGAPLSAWIYTVAHQLRALIALFVAPPSPERARGRVPMVLALRDFLLGRFGPRVLPN